MKKIAFISYDNIQEIFYLNDFNWNVRPSDHNTKEFKQLKEKVTKIIESNRFVYFFSEHKNDLKQFIKNNFIEGQIGTTKIQVDKNNFVFVYHKWLKEVQPSIAVDWGIVKKSGIIDGYFYLADLLSKKNKTLREKLIVLLKKDRYIVEKKKDTTGMFSSKEAFFKDKQKSHTQFWNKYQRPPKEEYWNYIIDRVDLLVPQDIRERKGSFYTPQIWVELSQKYITKVLGNDWQDEYTIWDCAAGTGNLLAGLVNKYNIYASTIDKGDVAIMKDRIESGANLLEAHVFQFDFLNDDFSKLPQPLQNIINNPEKRKKLIIYINPPYADASSNMKTSKKEGNSFNKIHKKYKNNLGNFAREIYAQFLTRIYFEIPNCKIAEFSKLKLLSVSHAEKMRGFFKAKLEKMFIVPAYTFDNVNGQFPIGFKIWNTKIKEFFKEIKAEVFDENNKLLKTKKFYSYDGLSKINKWIKNGDNGNGNGIKNSIGYMSLGRNDFQNNRLIYITFLEKNATNFYKYINRKNLIISAIYFAVQQVIPADWLNDRDQFLAPNKGWETDSKFQNDCLAYTLFHGQNRISSKEGTNHWIPFREAEINAQTKFESNFMVDFIQNKDTIGIEEEEEEGTEYSIDMDWGDIEVNEPEVEYRKAPLQFSKEAKAVFEAGKELWIYYHKQSACNVNASLYDIREHFQGRNAKGKMNNKSKDEEYNGIISNLRDKLKFLSHKIIPKVYEYGFLKR